MHALRAQLPSPRRLVAGLAAAAVATAGLACMGTAHAADPSGFPKNLDFAATGHVATGADVFAVGYIRTGSTDEGQSEHVDGYVEAVGSERQVHLGDGSSPSGVAASPDGETLFVIGDKTDEGDPERTRTNLMWTVDASTMTISDTMTFDPSESPYAVAAGSDGPIVAYVDYSGEESAGRVSVGGESVSLGAGVQPSQVAALSRGGSDEVVVVGADYAADGMSGQPTLRTVGADGTVSGPVVLGPDGTENRGFAVDMDVDEVNGLTYVVTARDVDGPQEYGLNIIGDGVDRFVDLSGFTTSVTVSADGETVYLSGSGVAAYDADALDSYNDDNPAPTSYFEDWTGELSLAPSGRLYVAQDLWDSETDQRTTKMQALEAPGAPSGLQVTPSEGSSQSMQVSWTAPASFGGVPDDSGYYLMTLTDQAGGEPFVQTNFMTEQELYDLVEGHTYTLSVVTTNGAFTSAPVTTTFTVQPAVAHPSAITIRGRLAVGSTLSLANTGSWATGTALRYTWYTDNDQVVSTASTLRLTKAHLGRHLFAQVTGTKAGSGSATVYSNFSDQVALGTLAARVPSVTGVAKVGKVLTAKPGRWTAGTRFSYRWLANGKVIKGATASRLKLKRAQAGKKITVRVTGTQPGYRAATKSSKATAKVKR